MTGSRKEVFSRPLVKENCKLNQLIVLVETTPIGYRFGDRIRPIQCKRHQAQNVYGGEDKVQKANHPGMVNFLSRSSPLERYPSGVSANNHYFTEKEYQRQFIKPHIPYRNSKFRTKKVN